MSVNKAILLGSIARGPWITRTTQGIFARLILTTAQEIVYPTGQRAGREMEHLLLFRGKYAEAIQRYASPGQLLYVEGRMTHRKYTDRNGSERLTHQVEVITLEFVSPTPEGVQDYLMR